MARIYAPYKFGLSKVILALSDNQTVLSLGICVSLSCFFMLLLKNKHQTNEQNVCSRKRSAFVAISGDNIVLSTLGEKDYGRMVRGRSPYPLKAVGRRGEAALFLAT